MYAWIVSEYKHENNFKMGEYQTVQQNHFLNPTNVSKKTYLIKHTCECFWSEL